MARFTARAGDRLLGVFLGRIDAGACVPENGQYCYCRNHYKWFISCHGACQPNYGLRC